MKILIDADACPVVDEAIQLSKKYGLMIAVICDTSHEIRREGCETLIADKGADSADLLLLSRVCEGDIVVTQDYGLAALCLARRAHALNQNGLVYTDRNIDELLFSRYASKKIRQAGGHTKGPPKRRRENDLAFIRALENLIIQNINKVKE